MMRPLILLFALTLFVLSCKRKGAPFPRICTESKDASGEIVTIKITDTLVLVNCSERYTKQRWVMPDGGSSTNETVYFVPPSLDTFLIKLYVSDDDFLNDYLATKKVVVVP